MDALEARIRCLEMAREDCPRDHGTDQRVLSEIIEWAKAYENLILETCQPKRNAELVRAAK
ncbi:MAG: hypothetical protein FD153_1344 [Rhodospirillaceae bacterium]|nr:MAG: hypothetical protein FD153_1344 [Rhodospirillaceae bacterium]